MKTPKHTKVPNYSIDSALSLFTNQLSKAKGHRGLMTDLLNRYTEWFIKNEPYMTDIGRHAYKNFGRELMKLRGES